MFGRYCRCNNTCGGGLKTTCGGGLKTTCGGGLENMRLLDKVNSLKKQNETLHLRLQQSEERASAMQREKQVVEARLNSIAPPVFSTLAERLSKRLSEEEPDWLHTAILCPEFISDVEQLLDTAICIVCVQRVKGVLFTACRHFVLCTQCASQLKICPICRTESDKINVFFS
jgi:hypothetical protein